MADANKFKSHVDEERFALLVNAVVDYAIYMIDPDGFRVELIQSARSFGEYKP